MAAPLALTPTFQSLQRLRSGASSLFKISEAQFSDLQSAETDATKAELSRGARAASESAQIVPHVSAGLFGSLISSLEALTNRMQEIDRQLSDQIVGSGIAEALAKERASLEKEVFRVTTESPTFQHLTELSRSSLQGFQTGATFGGAPSEAGASYGWLVANGQIAGVQAIDSALSSIMSTATDGSISIEDVSTLNGALSGIRTALGSADAPLSSAMTTSVAKAAKGFVEPLELQEISFQGASNLALGLRTASGENLIKAAALGVDFSPEKALILTLPENDEEKGKKHPSRVEIIPAERSLYDDPMGASIGVEVAEARDAEDARESSSA